LLGDPIPLKGEVKTYTYLVEWSTVCIFHDHGDSFLDVKTKDCQNVGMVAKPRTAKMTTSGNARDV
jgi:hypothetical protein